MNNRPADWIGKVFAIRDIRWHKPQQVRIVDAEVATGVCSCPRLTPCGRPDEPHTWFWAKYA